MRKEDYTTLAQKSTPKKSIRWTCCSQTWLTQIHLSWGLYSACLQLLEITDHLAYFYSNTPPLLPRNEMLISRSYASWPHFNFTHPVAQEPQMWSSLLTQNCTKWTSFKDKYIGRGCQHNQATKFSTWVNLICLKLSKYWLPGPHPFPYHVF